MFPGVAVPAHPAQSPTQQLRLGLCRPRLARVKGRDLLGRPALRKPLLSLKIKTWLTAQVCRAAGGRTPGLLDETRAKQRCLCAQHHVCRNQQHKHLRAAASTERGPRTLPESKVRASVQQLKLRPHSVIQQDKDKVPANKGSISY